MNANLLETLNYDGMVKQTQRGAEPPLMMEFPVNPELAPFLVSSTRSVQWVYNISKTDTLRAAVRERQGIEAEIVAAVIQRGQEAEWGNVHELTSEGVQQCRDHLDFYGIHPLEILVSKETDLKDIRIPEGVLIQEAPWMPIDALVIVPVDRGFLGTLGTLGKHKAVAVLHNPSRGIAVAWR